jgi:hypothetical protein
MFEKINILVFVKIFLWKNSMQKSNWIGSINYGFISICVVVGSTSSSSHLLLAVLHPSNLLAHIFIRIKHQCWEICTILIEAKHGYQPLALVQVGIFEVPATL